MADLQGIRCNITDMAFVCTEKQLANLKKKQLVEYRGTNRTGGYYVK